MFTKYFPNFLIRPLLLTLVISQLITASSLAMIRSTSDEPGGSSASTPLTPIAHATVHDTDDDGDDDNDAKKEGKAKRPQVPPTSQRKFKLGFEFQESSGLCAWASSNFSVQKKELFSLQSARGAGKLWHVVIDTDDIEFVTRPFNNTERDALEECVATILEVTQNLASVLTEPISFRQWVRVLNTAYPDRIHQEGILSGDLWEQPETGISSPSTADWKPSFSPQITIQHPLERTVFLYFGLFGFKEPDFMMSFVAGLPFRGELKEACETANSQKKQIWFRNCHTKMAGLLFLHALTLVGLAPNDDKTDTEFLGETKDTFDGVKQVDAKMKLAVMSRRPFSRMLSDVSRGEDWAPAVYINTFLSAFRSNTDFMQILEVPKLLYKTNYAEQFFDEAHGSILDLRHLEICFDDHFVTINRTVLLYLLERGVISTAMLRNLKAPYDDPTFPIIPTLNNSILYFKAQLSSVVTPGVGYKVNPQAFTGTPSRIDIAATTTTDTLESVAVAETGSTTNVRGGSVTPLILSYASDGNDGLSPPWFLDLDNSMGTFKDEDIDKRYGEALIEVRAVREVGDWFLRKASLNNSRAKNFLRIVGNDLIRESLSVFDFLNQLDDNTVTDDIEVGVTHAVYKH